MTWAVEIITQDAQPASTTFWWLTNQAGPSQAVEAGSANDILRARLAEVLLKGL